MSEVSGHDNREAQRTSAPTDQCLIRIDKTNSKNSHANIGHVASTKDEIVLNCELNPPWNQVEHTSRIILSPFAARRLAFFFKRGTVNLPEE